MSIRFASLSVCLLTVLVGAGCAGFGSDQATIAPALPINVSPIEATDIKVNTETRFVWQAVPTATHYDFHIFNRQSGDIERHFMRNLKARNVCNGGECSVAMVVALPFMRDHAWRVRAINSAGQSEWNRTRFNMVSANETPGLLDPPVEPIPLGPQNAAVLPNSQVEFIWLPADKAISYDFHFYNVTDGSMTSVVNDVPSKTVCNGSDCRLTMVVALPPAPNHAWRVRSVNEHGRSSWTRTILPVQERLPTDQ